LQSSGADTRAASELHTLGLRYGLTNSYCDSNGYSHTNANRHVYAYCDCDSHGDGNGHSNCDCYPNAYADSDTAGDAYSKAPRNTKAAAVAPIGIIKAGTREETREFPACTRRFRL
jgi:hypothetical protein